MLILSGLIIFSTTILSFSATDNIPKNPVKLMQQGKHAYQQEDYKTARELLRQALITSSDNEKQRKGRVLSKAERKEINRMLDTCTGVLTLQELFKEGENAYKKGDSKTAERKFTRILELARDCSNEFLQLPKVKTLIGETKAYLGKSRKQNQALAKAKAKSAKPKVKIVPVASESSESESEKKAKPKTVEVSKPVSKSAVKNEPKKVSAPKAKQLPKITPVKLVKPQEPTRPVQPTLLDEILAARQIQRQQAIISYQQTEKKIRQAVLNRQFLVAKDLLRQARQDLLRVRHLFTQQQFEKYMLNIDSLAKFIDTEKQLYEQQQISKQMKEAERKKSDREQKIQQEKFNKIKELFAQAIRLRREKKYSDAIEVCRQILAIEPNYERAHWFIEDLEDIACYTKQRKITDDIQRERRRALTLADEARVSWIDDIKYPKNWEELSKSRLELMRRLGKTVAGETPALITERKLKQTFFEDTTVFKGTLKKAFKIFRSRGIKVFVRWDVLEAEGVTADDEVKYDVFEGLKDISAKTALELIIKTMGPSEAGINYAIDTDGMVVVSTKDNLKELSLTPRVGRLETRVYNIADLMSYHPSLSGIPQVEPQQEEESIQQEDIEAKEFEELTDLDELVDLLKTLITTVVRPESWYENGGEGTIDVWRKRWLIIYQSPEVHDEISSLLETLRETQTVQIALEARFITVSSNFLEKIGLDLDIIFNQAHAGYDFTGAENLWGNTVPVGAGNQMVQPRTFSQLGALPASPVAGPGTLPPGYTQPYGHWGLIPTGGNSSPKSSKFTPIPMLNASNTLVNPEDTSLPGNLAGMAARPAFQIMGAFLDDLQVNFLLEATQMDRYSSIVQAPRVVMQNGTLGYIEVQNDVPYIESIEVTVGEEAAGQEPTVEYMGFGTVLAVRATTRDLRYVNMYIVPQLTVRAPDADLTVNVPIVAPGSVGNSTYVYPGRRTTRVESVVSVPDGGTLLVGGLKMNGEIELEAGPPVLSKMPIIKRFFSNTSKTKDNFTLLILVKPKIMVREELEPGVTTALHLGQ